MELTRPGAEIFVPDGTPADAALARTTHLGIGAHPDDLEVMAYHGILECFGRIDKWFTGVVVADGAGSPRSGEHANRTDVEMGAIRRDEQKKAACIGDYATLCLLDFPSPAVQESGHERVVEDLRSILSVARAQVIYTHNPADRHDTHVAVSLRVIRAIRNLPPEARPERLYGCEAWRDLDWLHDDDKVALDVGGNDNLETALLQVFDSQIAGGKRYDLATIGRRRAHATFHESHSTDETDGLIFAINLTPLLEDTDLAVEEYVNTLIRRLADDVASRIRRLI